MPYKLQVNGTNTTQINGQLVKNLVHQGKIYNFDRPEQVGISRFKIVNATELLNTSYTNYLYIALTKTTTTALKIRVNGNHITTLTNAGYQKVSLCNISSGTYAVDTLVVELDGGEFIMGQCPSGSNFLFGQYTVDSNTYTSAAEYSTIELGPNCIGSHNSVSLALVKDKLHPEVETETVIHDGITYVPYSLFSIRALVTNNFRVSDNHPIYDASCNGFVDKTTNTLIKGSSNTNFSDNKIHHIGNRAVYNNDILTSITGSETLQSIKAEAFAENAALTIVTLPSIVSIGNKAFMNSGVETLTLPSNFQVLGTQAFYNCPLKNIYVNKANPYFTSGKHNDQLIDRLTKTLLYTVGNTHIPQWIEHIGNYAYQNNTALSNLVLPSKIKSIGKQAFYGSSLKSIVLPHGLLEMGTECLSNSAITHLTIPGTVKIAQGFDYCRRLSSIVFEEGIQEIGSCNGTNLKHLTIPDSVTTIAGGNALGTVSIDLETIVIGRGLSDIPSLSFATGNSTTRSLSAVTFRHHIDDPLLINESAFGWAQQKKAIEVTIYHYGNEAVLNHDWSKSNITPIFVDLRESTEQEEL